MRKKNQHQLWKIRKAVQKFHKRSEKENSRQDDEEWGGDKAESEKDEMRQRQTIHN